MFRIGFIQNRSEKRTSLCICLKALQRSQNTLPSLQDAFCKISLVYCVIFQMYLGPIVWWQYPHNECRGRTLMGWANNAQHRILRGDIRKRKMLSKEYWSGKTIIHGLTSEIQRRFVEKSMYVKAVDKSCFHRQIWETKHTLAPRKLAKRPPHCFTTVQKKQKIKLYYREIDG